MDDDKRFVPRFHMPLIGPPPLDYPGDAGAYHADAAAQAGAAVINVPVEAELLMPPSGGIGDNAVRITLSNPDGTLQYSPNGTGPTPVLHPWRTLYALLGGVLAYAPSTSASGLNPHLPPPYNSLNPPLTPTPPAGLAAPWGTLVLSPWGLDARRLQEKTEDGTACGAIYYIGVDEISLAPHITAAIKALFPEDRYGDSVAAGHKPALCKVVERLSSTIYAQTPPYNTLIADHLDLFLNGQAAVMVRGGTPIGKAVIIGGSNPTARIDLWAVDASPSRAFTDLTPYLWAGAQI